MRRHCSASSRLLHLAILSFSALFVFTACGGEESNGNQTCTGAFCLEQYPVLEILPSTTVSFDKGAVDVGGETVEALQLRNTGDSILEFDRIELELNYEPGADEVDAPAFFLEGAPEQGYQLAPLGQETDTMYSDVYFSIGYRRYDGAPRSATVKIFYNGQYPDEPAVIQVTEVAGEANLKAIPSEMVFQNVQKNKFADRSLTLLNTGSVALSLDQVQLTGDTTFAVLVYPEDETNVLTPGGPVQIDPAVEISSGNSYAMTVRFSPVDETPQQAQLVVYTNDPSQPTKSINLLGNHAGPCIQVEPQVVNFGSKLVAQSFAYPVRLHSCGQDNLEITSIQLAEDGSSDYSLDLGTFTVDGQGLEWPSTQFPGQIPVNRDGEFHVLYTPDQESPVDSNGSPIPDVTQILIETNTFEGTIAVDVTGFGTLDPCPTAVISIVEGGSEVPPQTTLKLSAENSIPSAGNIIEYQWDAVQPPGSASIFFPDKSQPLVDFPVNVAGKYTFRLEVRDAEAWSCTPAERDVLVIPDEAIHVELVWDTPGDLDPTDEGYEVGSDLDLHFVHKENAEAMPPSQGVDLYPPEYPPALVPVGDGLCEGYFDDIWDTFWFYTSKEWGIIGVPDDNPSLDRDDTDGAGPENLNLNVPEPGVHYKIGVHYWNDWGFGKSTPTVKFYIFGNLKVEQVGCPMVKHDMWEVGTIAWPSQQIDIYTCTGEINATTSTDCTSDANCSAGYFCHTNMGGSGVCRPERPCGSSTNNLVSETGEIIACDQVIMRDYIPDNFLINIP